MLSNPFLVTCADCVLNTLTWYFLKKINNCFKLKIIIFFNYNFFFLYYYFKK